ncbi:unnamed protein product, partial [Iphiclides podalirius]
MLQLCCGCSRGNCTLLFGDKSYDNGVERSGAFAGRDVRLTFRAIGRSQTGLMIAAVITQTSARGLLDWRPSPPSAGDWRPLCGTRPHRFRSTAPVIPRRLIGRGVA